MSSSIPSRELRDSTRAVLDRIGSGEELTITVDGCPVAKLSPISRRPDSISKDEFRRLFEGHQADAGLADDIRELVGDETTDDTYQRALTLEPVPLGQDIAERWAELRLALRRRDPPRKMPVNHSWIAATALHLDIPVVTQDDDYDGCPGLDVIGV